MSKKINILLPIALCGLVFVFSGSGAKGHLDDDDCSLEWFSDNEADSDDENSSEAKFVRERYEDCESNFISQIKKTADRLTKEEQEDVKLLTGDVINQFGGDFDFHSLTDDELDNLYFHTDGIKKIIEKLVANEVKVLEGNAGKAKAIREVSAKVKSMCKKTYKGLKEVNDIFDIITPLVEVDNIGEDNQKWLVRGRICGVIHERYTLVITSECEKAFIKNYIGQHEPERRLLEEWKEHEAKLFNEDDEIEAMTPVDVQKHLKRIQEISATIVPLGLLTKGDRWRVDGIDELIRLGEVSKTKCNPETFERFRVNKIIYKYYPKTLFVHLENSLEQQKKLCDN